MPKKQLERPRVTAQIDTTIPDVRSMMSVEGKILPEEAVLLYKLASRVTTGCIVEVGSYRGQSTVALALGTRCGHSVPVFAIDPHEEFVGVNGGRFGPEDRVAFCRNLLAARCLEAVRLVNLPARQIARGWDLPIGLLWIDGDHRYQAVKGDFESFSPWVVQGGLVAFHDADQDPGRVVREALASGGFREVLRVGSVAVIVKGAG